MVFNERTMSKHSDIAADRQLIDELGGPAKVAELLGYDKTAGGVQRVQNWKKRGIPADVKIAHPELFLTKLMETKRMAASDDVQPPVGGLKKHSKLARASAVQ
ncbi:hypothetical protein Bphy_1910 [Paraburkholderia phymatum STM815]|uniref:Uncharacterized protein n=2 Tax=Paraburkholderia phymatum TaxID=148447 RepID=B2JD33_PARP8|nr:hypothetical protein Bphy_1910 [Paraburkholderia phymatum STM815]